MYSGTTLIPMKYFDAWFGAHQKIDRVARRHLADIFQGRGYHFPKTWEILKFEGLNGPDGIKRKTPAKDELWHYYNPHDPADGQILGIIEDHYKLLVAALREANQARAAFEAAWLAHALVDGLTPAHHYPYEEELVRLRGGKGIETRTSAKEKLLMPGDTVTKRVGNNWKMWGDKGLMATHLAFEFGIAIMISPLRIRLGRPADADLIDFRHKGIGELFRTRAKQIADLQMYEAFYKSGWTPKLAKQARRELIPLIVSTVTLAWYGAIVDSQKVVKARYTRKGA